VTGGIASEALAITLRDLDIPFEMFFLDLWGINQEAFHSWEPNLRKLTGKTVTEISISRGEFYDSIPDFFSTYGIGNPTCIALAHLYRQIPRDSFIVSGGGNPSLRAPSTDMTQPSLAYSPAVAFPYLWATHEGRQGEYSFFSSQAELVAAGLGHRIFTKAPYPEFREIFYTEFQEIARRVATTNWDTPVARRERQLIRSWILRQKPFRFPALDFWQPESLTEFSLEELFAPRT
jgi:hypothetical protein